MIYAAKPKDVIIEPRFKPDKTSSGLLYLPETARERCTQGIVKGVGREVTEIKIGDRVGFSGYSGTLARVGDELIIVMPEKEIDFIFTLDDPDYGLYVEDVASENRESFVSACVKEIKKSCPHIKEEDVREILLLSWDFAPFRKVSYPEMIKHVETKMRDLGDIVSRDKEGDITRKEL